MGWEGMAPPEKSTQPQEDRGIPEDIAGSFAEGVYRSGAAMAGLPVDIATRAFNLIPGVDIQQPVGGSQWLMEQKRRAIGGFEPQTLPGRVSMAVGEQVPAMIPVGKAVQGLRAAVPTNINALTGAQLTRPIAAAVPTAVGTGLGVAGARELFPGTPAAEIAGAVIGGTAAGLPAMVEKNLDKYIDKTLRFATPTTSTKAQGISGESLQKYTEHSRNAVKNLVHSNREMPFSFRDGEVVTTGLPQNRLQFASAIDQMKSRLYKTYNSEQQKAGKEGLIFDGDHIAKVIERVYRDPKLPPSVRAASKYALDKADMYRKFGNMTPQQVEDELAVINSRISAHSKSNIPSEATNIDQDIKIANILRKELDNGISRITGGKYQKYRNQYRDIRSMQKSVTDAAVRQLNEDAKKGISDKWDAAITAELMGSVMYGIGTQHWGGAAAGITSGIAAGALKRAVERSRNPDRRLTNMFNTVDERLPQRQYFAGPTERKIDFTTGPYEPEVLPPKSMSEGQYGLPVRSTVEDAAYRDLRRPKLPGEQRTQIGFDPKKSPIPMEQGRPTPGPELKASRIASIQSDVTKDAINRQARKEGWTKDQVVLRQYELGVIGPEELKAELPNLSTDTLMKILLKGVK